MVDASDPSYRLQQDVSRLRYSLNQLQSDLDTLGNQVDELETNQDVQDERIDSIQSGLDQIADDVHDQQGVLHDVRAVTGGLAARVDWLDHHLRQLAGLEPVVLDRHDDTTRRLVRQILAGHAAASDLLTDEERAELEDRCKAYTSLEDQKLRSDHQTVEAIRTIAGPSTSNGERADAEAAFDYANERRKALARQIESTTGRYQSDRDRLARDDQALKQAQPAIEAGHEARTELRARTRDRITTALGNRDLFPIWFTTTLGYGPSTNTTRWLDVAANALTYRMTYGIDDPDTALGNASPDATPAQSRWRDQLLAALDGLRRA